MRGPWSDRVAAGRDDNAGVHACKAAGRDLPQPPGIPRLACEVGQVSSDVDVVHS